MKRLLLLLILLISYSCADSTDIEAYIANPSKELAAEVDISELKAFITESTNLRYNIFTEVDHITYDRVYFDDGNVYILSPAALIIRTDNHEVSILY